MECVLTRRGHHSYPLLCRLVNNLEKMESDTLSKLSDDKIKELAENVTRNATPYGPCLLSGMRKSRDAYVYSCLTEVSRGIRGKLVGNHRIIYFSEHKDALRDRKTVVSHRCHMKSCINIDHLSLEPQTINLERKKCFKNKSKRDKNICFGHEAPYEPWIFFG